MSCASRLRSQQPSQQLIQGKLLLVEARSEELNLPTMELQNEVDTTAAEKEIWKQESMTTAKTPIAPTGECFDDTGDEYDSDGTDIVGDMSRGMIWPPDVVGDQEPEGDEDDAEDVEPEDEVAIIEDSDLNAKTTVRPIAEVREHDRRPFALSRSEVVSLVVHDMAVKYKAPRSYVQDQRRLHAALGTTVLDYRTVRRRVCNMTGIKDVRYDCCPKGCMSYAMFPDLATCLEPDCQHPRWKDVQQKVPYAQHSYIPVTQRLLLWWGNSSRAESMLQYRINISDDRTSTRDRLDFWTGTLYHQFRVRGLFADKTDLAFILSSDGVKVSCFVFSLRIIRTQLTMSGVQK
jgi:hypothetical protein